MRRIWGCIAYTWIPDTTLRVSILLAGHSNPPNRFDTQMWITPMILLNRVLARKIRHGGAPACEGRSQ